MGKDHMSRLMNSNIENLKKEIETDTEAMKTVYEFTTDNNSLDPTTWTEQYILTNNREVKKIFRKLNNKKSTGPDKIPNIVLKHLP